MTKPRVPKVLFLDVETFPLETHVWSLFGNERIGLNQLQKDWSMLSWAAKWQGKTKVHYADVSQQKNLRDDKKLLEALWPLLDECDVLIGHNLNSFDRRKVNARLAIHGITPPSPYKVIDTKTLVKRHFDFTSNSLEYISGVICKKNKKLKHKRFPGQELWTECLRRNKAAWREMKLYNIADTRTVEEVFEILKGWGTGLNLNAWRDQPGCPQCGGHEAIKRGFEVSTVGKWQRYQCTSCGHWFADKGAKNNLMVRARKEQLKKPV